MSVNALLCLAGPLQGARRNAGKRLRRALAELNSAREHPDEADASRLAAEVDERRAEMERLAAPPRQARPKRADLRHQLPTARRGSVHTNAYRIARWEGMQVSPSDKDLQFFYQEPVFHPPRFNALRSEART